MDRMFEFITETWNPVAGACPYECSYCWAKDLINRYKYAKYQGPPRLDEKAMKKIPDKGFIFVQDMSDIGVLDLENSRLLFTEIFWKHGATWLFLTKNPAYYRWLNLNGVNFGGNMILGATIETDIESVITANSKAPNAYSRLEAMRKLSQEVHTPLFVSVEPVMRFSPDFAKKILALKPMLWGVAIGYDNYNNNLDEPSSEAVKDLGYDLVLNGVKVYWKTIREAHVPHQLTKDVAK